MNKYGHPIFTAYLKLRNKQQPIDLYALYCYLASKLPAIMIPARWIMLEEIPLTSSKKLDVKRLPTELIVHYLQGRSGKKPQSQLEQEIATIWSEVLQIDELNFSFNLDDNFQQLGGTSLQSANLLQMLHNKYKLKLSFSEFIHAPTIASLARHIRRLTIGNHALVKIHPAFPVPKEAVNNKTLPLFLVHSLMGDPEQDYAKLVEHWNYTKPIYGLKARGLADPSDMDDSLHVLAMDYIKEIKRIQPQGPYLIGGWSAGGDIALIMTAILTARNEKAFLLMIDSESMTLFQEKNNAEYADYLLDFI